MVDGMCSDIKTHFHVGTLPKICLYELFCLPFRQKNKKTCRNGPELMAASDYRQMSSLFCRQLVQKTDYLSRPDNQLVWLVIDI